MKPGFSSSEQIRKSPPRSVYVLRKRKIPSNSLKAEKENTSVLMFLTATVKAYSCRYQAQNNQYKRHSAVWERLWKLMVWCEIYSQVYSLLFENKTGSKEVQLIHLQMTMYGALVTLEDSMFGPGKSSKIPMLFLLSVKLQFCPVHTGKKNYCLCFVSLCSWVNIQGTT